MSTLANDLKNLNGEKEQMRLKLTNLKRKTKIVCELMAKYQKKLPRYHAGSVKSFMQSAEAVRE